MPALKMRGRGQEPRDAGGLLKVKRARKESLQEPPEGSSPADTLVLALEMRYKLMTSRVRK